MRLELTSSSLILLEESWLASDSALDSLHLCFFDSIRLLSASFQFSYDSLDTHSILAKVELMVVMVKKQLKESFSNLSRFRTVA